MLLLHLTLLVATICAQCPRRKGSSGDRKTNGDIKAPGILPEETFITCTFMHNDKSEADVHFSAGVITQIKELKKRLQKEIRVNVHFEEANCANGHEQCKEYRVKNPFHWIFIEDSAYGAAVYELNSKLNSKPATVEASLLNSLSQHSAHDLTKYCSKEANKEVGFIKQLTTEELLERRIQRSKSRSNALVSPFETDMLEPILLDLREYKGHIKWRKLVKFDHKTFSNAVERSSTIFVLFWTNESVVSQHTFHLWAEASDILTEHYKGALFGAVPCHIYEDLCSEYVVESSDEYAIFALKGSEITARTQYLRDAAYYIGWVDMILDATSTYIHNEDHLKKIKKGMLDNFDGVRAAITVGIFDSSRSKAMQSYLRLAETLKGRYHFAHYIKDGSINTVYTIRANEKKKRTDYVGQFDEDSLAEFIAVSSLPTVYDITFGFTSSILMHQPRTVVTLLESGETKEIIFQELCSKSPNVICTKIRNKKLHGIERLLKSIGLSTKTTALLMFIREKIYVYDGALVDTKLTELIAGIVLTEPKVTLGFEDPHPLRYLQLDKINEVFGEQKIKLLSEVEMIQKSYHLNLDALAGDNSGGCPMMSHARLMQTKRNEL